MSNSAHAYLVESIPKGLEDLRGTPGVAYTEDVLVQLTTCGRPVVRSVNIIDTRPASTSWMAGGELL
jgi:hypothetical protein